MNDQFAETWVEAPLPASETPVEKTEGDLALEIERQDAAYDPIDWTDFDKQQAAEPDAPELISGIFRKGEKMVLGGSSKSHKTWSLLDLAISIATGTPWWGRATTRAVVLYVDMELPKKQLHKRITAILKSRGLKLERGWLHVVSLRGKVVNANTCIEHILRKCPKHVGLIVLDPIYKLNAGRNENDAGEIASLLNQLERLAVETDSGVVYAAHYPKGNQAQKDTIDRIAGSGVYARDADTMVMLTKHQEEDCLAVELVLRSFPPVAPWVMRWQHPLMMLDASLDPSKLRRSRGGKIRGAEDNAYRLLDFLDTPTRYTVWMKKAAENGIEESSFKKYYRILKKAGKIIKTGKEWKKV